MNHFECQIFFLSPGGEIDLRQQWGSMDHALRISALHALTSAFLSASFSLTGLCWAPLGADQETRI